MPKLQIKPNLKSAQNPQDKANLESKNTSFSSLKTNSLLPKKRPNKKSKIEHAHFLAMYGMTLAGILGFSFLLLQDFNSTKNQPQTAFAQVANDTAPANLTVNKPSDTIIVGPELPGATPSPTTQPNQNTNTQTTPTAPALPSTPQTTTTTSPQTPTTPIAPITPTTPSTPTNNNPSKPQIAPLNNSNNSLNVKNTAGAATTTPPANIAPEKTVRTGGLETSLGIIAIFLVFTVLYYYISHSKAFRSLKTVESKLNTKRRRG